MPLSDREQQILKEIERDLIADGTRLDDSVKPPTRSRDQLRLGVLIFVVGIVCLVLFFVTSAILLGIAAFGAMVGGLVLIGAGAREAAARGFRDLSSRSPHGFFGRPDQRDRGPRDRS